MNMNCAASPISKTTTTTKQQPAALNCSALVAGTPSGLVEFLAHAACTNKPDVGCCENAAVNGKLKTDDVAAAAAAERLMTAELLVTTSELLLSHSAADGTKENVTQSTDGIVAVQQFGTSLSLTS